VAEPAVQSGEIDGIPVVWLLPDSRPRGAALWLTHLGGSTAQTIPMLTRLADRGLLAVSFDPPGHGRRGTLPPQELAGAILSAFRRRMWPLLGRTTLECLRVLDWIDQEFAVPGPRVAGGVSMGGDVAVALAGIDARITRVSGIVATPDWTRPGMTALGHPSELLEQCEADSYARWFYDALDPLSHVDAYRRDVAIDFQCGAADTHVPADGALRFRDRLLERDPDSGRRIRVDVHPGLSHLDGGQDDKLWTNALDWLADAE
jgi:uncharacterized protein